MKKYKVEFLVGLFALLSLAALAWLTLQAGAEESFLEPGARITMTESAVDLESLIGKMAFGAVDKADETKDQKAE